MNKEYKYLVCVQCMTYNQASFITETLNGFCMQITTFPFVCCIIDDASDDSEPDVIKSYLHEHFYQTNDKVSLNEETDDYVMTFVRHKENQNCYFAVYFLKYNHYHLWDTKLNYISRWRKESKYVAICEGDDYWIDQYKLHKQVSFLEENPQYVMVRTNVHRYHQTKGILERDYFDHSKKITDTKEFYIMHTLWLGTCTWLYRNIYDSLDYSHKNEDLFYGDIYLLLNLSQIGDIMYFKESTAVYRILGDSASHFKSGKDWFYFSWRCKNTRLLFARNYPFYFKLKFWFLEFLRNGYKAIRASDIKCLVLAIKSVYKDFVALFIPVVGKS